MKQYSIFIVINSEGEHICEWCGSYDSLDEALERKEFLELGVGGDFKTLIWETF